MQSLFSVKEYLKSVNAIQTESCRGVSPFITANKICAEWLEQALEVLYNKEKHSKAISCNKEKGFLNGKRKQKSKEQRIN
ncbi:MAG: hypothetical protein ACLU6P_11910 [Roseburia intestinalis]